MNGKKTFAALAAVLALLAPACGGGSDASGDGREHAGGDDAHSDHSDDYVFGEPADPADADRTITVKATDAPSFEPEAIELELGETVAFELVNEGTMPHELVLGDEASMQAHVHGGEAPNGTGEIPAGETATIAWTFTETGEFVYECHVDDHHKQGMRGTISVK